MKPSLLAYLLVVLIFGLSLAVGIISVHVYVRGRLDGPIVLAFTISGFVLAASSASVLLLLHCISFIHCILHLVFTLFHISCGAVLLAHIAARSNVPQLMVILIPVLLMTNTVVSTIFVSLRLSVLYANWLSEIQLNQDTVDLENQISDGIPTIVPSKRTSLESASAMVKESSQFLSVQPPHIPQAEISKKVSEKTLVNETRIQVNAIHIDSIPYIKYDSAFPLDLEVKTTPHIPSINFDSNRSTLVNTASSASNDTAIKHQHISYQSANLLFTSHSEKTPVSNKIQLVSEPLKSTSFQSTSELSPVQITASSNLPKVRRKTSVETQINATPKRAPIVHKSKSTSILSAADLARAEEKKILITNEKELILSINESLLPPLLRQGESPILERQRQQKEHELLQRRQTQKQVSRVERPNKFARSKSFTEKKAASTTELSRILESNNLSDCDSAQLSYIEEFSGGHSSLDQTAFANFDGTYASPIQQNQITEEEAAEQPEEEQINREMGSPPRNKSNNSFNGLENVQGYSQWDPTTISSKNSASNLNHISLGDWLQNSEQWEQRQVSSGVRIASFPTKVIEASPKDNMPKTYTYDDLMLDDGQRNITSYFQRSSHAMEYAPNESFDRIFDVTIGLDQDSTDESQRVAKLTKSQAANSALNSNMLERSASAPSLHTFRKPSENTDSSRISSGTGYSGTDVEQSLKIDNIDGDALEGSEPHTPKPSPIKKFFQESPRKLSNVFKRNSRTSYDGSFMYPRHKHTGSSVSNQFSMHSSASSKSSPKKSLKSMLTYKAPLSRTEIARRNSQTQISKPVGYIMHQAHNSVPNFSSFQLDSGMVDHYYTKYTAPEFSSDHLEMWDIHTVQDSDNSRVSSVPSAVIGQYDREKWRTLKEHEAKNSQASTSKRLST